MEIFNLQGDEWNDEVEHEDFSFKDAYVGARIGAELIGGSLYEVRAGKEAVAVPHPSRERGVGDRASAGDRRYGRPRASAS